MSFYFFIILFFTSSIDKTLSNLITQVDGVNIKYKVTRYGTFTKAPVSSKLVSLHKIPLSECLYQCIIRPKCEGLNYWRTFTLCDIVSGNGNLERSSNCLYIKRSDIDTESPTCKAGGCDRGICDKGGKCIVRELISPTKCTRRAKELMIIIDKLECGYPEVPNGKPLGNMFGVGDTQVIKCESDFSIRGSKTLKCMENKVWDTIPECWKDCNTSVFHHAEVEHFRNVSGSYAVVKCHDEYISNRTANKTKRIRSETVGCAKNGSWTPNIDCIYIDNLLNVAWNKPTNQSSTYKNAAASKATDGIWDSDYRNGSCSHTNISINEAVGWLEVDLQQTYTIRKVTILNRKSDTAYFKFKHVTVTIGNSSYPNQTCSVYEDQVKASQKVEFTCNEAIAGRFVRISKPNTSDEDNLALCEVGIYEN